MKKHEKRWKILKKRPFWGFSWIKNGENGQKWPFFEPLFRVRNSQLNFASKSLYPEFCRLEPKNVILEGIIPKKALKKGSPSSIYI